MGKDRIAAWQLLGKLLHHPRKRGREVPPTPLASELAHGVVRHLSRLDWVLEKASKKEMEQVEEKTRNCKDLTLNIAFDFGGRWDIVQAAKRVAQVIRQNKIEPNDISEETFGSYLSLAGLPEPDLLIRTSGEQRISNFLLWDLAYAELYFTEAFWPDFDGAEFKKAIEVYQNRSRRFGNV